MIELNINDKWVSEIDGCIGLSGDLTTNSDAKFGEDSVGLWDIWGFSGFSGSIIDRIGQ